MADYDTVLAELNAEIDHLERRPPCEWTEIRLCTLWQIRSWLTSAYAEHGDGDIALAVTREAVIGSLLAQD